MSTKSALVDAFTFTGLYIIMVGIISSFTTSIPSQIILIGLQFVLIGIWANYHIGSKSEKGVEP